MCRVDKLLSPTLFKGKYHSSILRLVLEIPLSISLFGIRPFSTPIISVCSVMSHMPEGKLRAKITESCCHVSSLIARSATRVSEKHHVWLIAGQSIADFNQVFQADTRVSTCRYCFRKCRV